MAGFSAICSIPSSHLHTGARITNRSSTLWSPERQAGATKIIGPAYTVKYVRKDVRYVPSQGLIALPLEYSQRHYVSFSDAIEACSSNPTNQACLKYLWGNVLPLLGCNEIHNPILLHFFLLAGCKPTYRSIRSQLGRFSSSLRLLTLSMPFTEV